MSNSRIYSSFRDPSGFLFKRNDIIYRQVNQKYAAEYSFLLESGLYQKLVKANLLIPHNEVDIPPEVPDIAYRVIQPDQVWFISYPYEWSFSQLKDAALSTLSIQKRALKLGMSLKDASAYNIQFHKDKAVLIDTLSFEMYKDGEPWVAYKQFCQHFLAPLALMAKTDARLSQLLRIYIDGIPLDLTSRLLPASTHLNFGLLTHIHIHARAQVQYADKAVVQSKKGRAHISKQSLLGMIENMEDTVRSLEWKSAGTEWGNYYEITNYTDVAFDHKKKTLSEWLDRVKPLSVCDLGANNGVFTRLASSSGIPSISFDLDPAAVEQNYLQVKSTGEWSLLPLVQDLTNPSPSIGWQNFERESFMERVQVDMVFALALVHHLAISNNVPLTNLAEFFSSLSNWLVIEFVPKSDSQVQKLLVSRLDIFDQYTPDNFEQAFESRFILREKVHIRESERCLYLMENRMHVK